MAHFAELDNNNIVLRVVVVGNDITANGGTLEDNDMHTGNYGVLIFLKVELGNKLLIIIILENNIVELVILMTLLKINLLHHNLTLHGY